MTEQEITGTSFEDTPIFQALKEKAELEVAATNPPTSTAPPTTIEPPLPSIVTPVAQEVDIPLLTITPEAEATPAAEATEKKSVLDLLKDEPVAETTTTTELSDDIKSQLELAKEYKQLLEQGEQNPFLQLLKMQGKPEDLVKLAQELIPIDESKLPLNELLKKNFETELGLEGEDLTQAIEERTAELADMPKWKQAQAEKELRDKFKPTPQESKFLNQYKQAYEQQLNSIPKEPSPEEIKQWEQEDKTQISEFAKGLVGMEFDGVEISQEHINTIVNDYNLQEANLKYIDNKTSKINVKKFIQEKLQTNPKITEARVDAAYKRGKQDALKESAGLRTEKSGDTGLSQTEQPQDMMQAAIYDFFPHLQNQKTP